MTDSETTANPLFYQLILSLHAGSMQQLGKVASPATGKVERDLVQAKMTIDLIEMLKLKTEGNLVEDERKLLDHVLFELRMNYVDEIKKDKESPAAEGSSEGAQPDDKTDDNENKS